ncbi:13742_t:CDS:2, partial [Dentiscutata heterogama]
MKLLFYVGIILLLYIAYYYYAYFTRPNPLPGPFPLPFIGTLLQIGLEPRKWEEKNLNSKSLSKESKFSKRGMAAFDEVGIANGIVFNNNFHKWKRSRQFVTK